MFYFLIAEFCDYIEYTRNLQFVEEPNYFYLRNLFKSIMTRYGYVNDYKFDWTKQYEEFVKSKNILIIK